MNRHERRGNAVKQRRAMADGQRARKIAAKMRDGTATRGEVVEARRMMENFLDTYVRKPARGGP